MTFLTEQSDFGWERSADTSTQSHLANGIGNGGD